MSQIDDFLSGKLTPEAPSSIDDFLGIKPKKRRRRAGDVVEDLAKGFGGAAVSAVGAVQAALGRAVQEGGEMLFGLSMDEARRLAEAEGTPEKALEWYERANRFNPVSAAGRAIESGGRRISEQGDSLRNARSDEAKERARQFTPDGDLTKPSTWTMGENPSVEGFAHVLADVVGSMAPPVATAIATRGRSAATQMRAGGATVAGQIGGSAMDEAREYLGQFDDNQLRQVSPVFRELEAKGYSAADARTILEREVENRAATYAAPVGFAGGQATGALLGKPGEKLAGKFAGMAPKAIVLGVLGATEEGLQEVIEGVATRAGINDAAGTDRSLTEGTFGEFVLGAKGGGATGAGKGVLEGLAQRGRQAPAATTPGTPPAPQPTTPGAPPAPVAQTPATPPATNPSARLAELEILAEQRDLTPVEQKEAADLLAAMSDEQADVPLTDEGKTPAADATLMNEGATPAAEVVPEPVVGPQGGTAQELSPASVASDFWSFAKSKGFTPGQIKVGTPEHAALKAEYDALKAGKAEPILPPLQPQPSVDLQNRDRSRAASVVQMSDIARNPDYMRLGPSRTPDSGAPMVFAVGDQLDAIAPENFGRQDVAVMSDGQRVPFRYAVVDATKVNPSNFADGRQNPEFNSTTPGTIKALNNGRTAGVRAAHEMGTAGEYVAGMQADEAMHGIPADVIARTPNPMLVRIYSDAANTANMAAKSQGQGLGMSPAELARQDAPLMDSSVLGVYEPGEITSAANRDFVRAFIGKLQAAGQDVAGMMTGDGQLSQDGRKRIQAALMQAAYGDSGIVEEMFDSTDTDIKAIGEALKAVAGQWAKMRDSAKLGAINPQTDITQNLIQAIGLIRKARRDGTMLYDLVNQPDLMTGETPDATTVGVLRMFYSGQYMTRAVGKDKLTKSLSDYVTAAMATSADPGMFGDVVTAGEILATINPITEGQRDAEAQPEEGRGQPAGSGDPGVGAGEARTAVGRQRAGESGAGVAADRGSEPGQDAAPEAQQQVGQGDPRAEEGDGAAAARAGAGQQEGADGQAAAAEGRAGAADSQAVKAKKPKSEPDALPADQVQRLERDFRAFPTQILNNLLERGEAAKLYKAAGVKGASAFGDLAMDDKAAAYVKFVQQGGKPVENLSKDYNAWVKSEERAAEVRRLQSDRVVRQENGKPFKSKTSAQQYQERYDLTGTHEVVAVDGGFELRQLSPAAQAELKRKAEGRESYTEAQAAVAEEMGIGQTPDGEWDATDDQFDEMERRVQARMRGEPAEPLLTNPTREDVLAQQERAENAQAADEREQIRRESEAGAGTFSLEMQDGRQDTTADLFRQTAAAPAPAPARAKTPIARLQDEIRSAERKLENLKEQARKARAAVNFAKEQEINEKILILQSELKGMRAELEAMQASHGVGPAGDAVDPFEGMNLPDQVKEYLLKPSVIMKDGSTVSTKDFVDGLLADGYGNPEYFVAPKGSQVGFLSKPGSPKVTLNAKQMFYADAVFMAKKRAQKKQEQAAIERHGLPEGTTFSRGKGMASGKWIARAGDTQGNLSATIDEAASSLAQFLQLEKRREENAADMAALSKKVADKLKRGEQPTDAELRDLFGLDPRHTYVKQSAVGQFLVDYMGVPRNKIRESLGKAAGTVTSDSGTKYPIVYPRKLHEVFGTTKAADDAQAGDKQADPFAGNKLFTSDKAAAARERLRKKLSGSQLNSGIDPEMMMDGITLAGYHIEKGARTFAAYARAMLADLGDGARPYLKSWYMGVKYDPRAAGFDGMDDAATVESADLDALTAQENDDVPGSDVRVERDRQEPAPGPAVGDAVPDDAGGSADGNRADGGRTRRGGRRGQPDGAGVSTGGAVAGGERSNLGLPGGDPAAEHARVSAGADFGERGSDIGVDGVSTDPIPATQVDAVATRGDERAEREQAQRRADRIPVIAGNAENIRQTLPYLLAGQQEDVAKAEARFAQPDGYGMLFTNGTGTGKTFTGLGIVKRFERQGKGNVLIVVPDDKIASDWIESGRALGLTITALRDTKDAGHGITVTTYANLGDNDALVSRQWDLFVADEAHELMKSADGYVTKALAALRALSLHPDGAHTRYEMLNRTDIQKAAALGEQIKVNLRMMSRDDTMDVMVESLRRENQRMEAELAALYAKLDAARTAVREDVKSRQGASRPRAVFLSATPFAYEFNIDWANGYLFDYNEGQPADGFRPYNSGSNRDRFFMTHFGYTMRYNKLTKPDPSKVDTGLMQRQFNSWLKQRGALSARMLDVPADYDRKFVLVDSAIGNRIDEALAWLDEQRLKDKSGGLGLLRDVIDEKFDYLSRRYLLEAIKATEAVPIVREHLRLGRKVVVFHDYKKGGGFNPFDIQPSDAPATDGERQADIEAFNAALHAFREKFKDLVEAPLGRLPSSIEVFKREFPDVLLINGDEKKSDLLARYKRFQDDASGPQVMLVQSAKNKGWSGHDTTGKHQRVLINLGLPTAPTLAIQQEGRIYRTGQVSNAIIRYLNTGTNWERWAFATTIASRASTTENLAMGEQARALKDAFIAAFEESDAYPPGHEGEGTGGKARDAAANNALTAYDRAKSFYWATQKKSSKTKAQEGIDYFATPEPVGLKMAEWLALRGGEEALEPSAGHGAIARWLPDTVKRTVIEPSTALRARLAMVMSPKDDRIIDGTFEDHHVSNKYDGIVMNPPFGVGGKTAIEHLAKAATHLRDGGRIVALIPTGPAADKRYEQWMYGTEQRPVKPLLEHPTLGSIYAGDTVRTRAAWAPEGRVVRARDGALMVKVEGQPGESMVSLGAVTEVQPTGARTREVRPAEGIYTVGEIRLPQVTFERAGTKVATRIVILEKQTDRERAPNARAPIDLTDVTDIRELFDRLESLEMPGRRMTAAQEQAAEAERAEQERARQREEARAKKAEPGAPKAANPDAVGTVDRAGHEIIEHVTQKGKTIRGIVRTDLLKEEAQKIDPYTFRKDGGWFIREVYLKGDDAPMMSRTKPEEAAARRALARIMKSGVTSADDLRDLLRVPGYSQWAQSALAGDVDATRALRDELAQAFGSADWRAPKLNDQGIITLYPDWDGLSVDSIRKLVEIADRYDAPVALRGGPFTNPQPRLFETAGFVPYTGLTERMDRPAQVMFTMIRPAGGITATTPLFSKQTRPSAMTEAAVRQVADTIKARWTRAPDVVVVQNMQDMRVPEAARLEDARQRAAGATGVPRGFYHRGTVYLVADGLGSVRDVAETLFHEALGHYGLRAVFGSALDGILDQIAMARPDLMRPKAKEYGKDLKVLKQRREVAEEVLSEMAQTRPNLGFVKRAIAAIRTWLRQNVPGFKDLALTDAEIINSFILPARNWVERGERAGGSNQDIRFSRSTDPSVSALPDTFKAARQDARGETPAQDGASRGLQSRAQKVFDQQGRPLVVYHGTSLKNLQGILKKGLVPRGKKNHKESGDYVYVEASAKTARAWARQAGGTEFAVLEIEVPESQLVRDSQTLSRTSFRAQRIPARLIKGWDVYRIDPRTGDLEYVRSESNPGFRPEQTKSATGNNGNFDPEDADIRFSRSTLGNTPPTPPQNPNAWQKLKAKALELTSPDAIESLIYEYQDKYIDLKRLRDHINELGGTISDLNDAYLGEELYHKRLAKRAQDFLSEELKPLLADMRARGVDMPTLERYLHARHAPEANRVLAERNPNAQMIEAGKAKALAEVKALEVQLQRARAQGAATKAIEQALEQALAERDRWTGAQAFNGTEAERLSLSGMSDQEAAAFMGGLPAGQRVHLEALAARVDAMQAKTLELLEKYGLMDKATLDAWRSTYQFYVPLHRDEAHPNAVSHPIGQGFSTKGDASKRRTGSNEKVTNILAHIAMQREAALTRGEKNRVAKKLYLMAAQNPDPEIWSVDKLPMMKTVDLETGFVRTTVDPTYRNKPNVVMVRIGGKDHAITFNERNPKAVRMAQSIKGADVDDLNAFESIMGKATRWLASVNTQYNPIFGIINFARDVQAAILQLSTTPLKGQERAVAAYVPAALKGIYAEVRSRRKGQPRGTGQWAKLWEDMQNEGGTTGYRDLFITPDERVKALTKELNALERGKVSEAAHALVDWLSDYNETMENAVRLAAYKVALDQGMSKERAASLAKNLTVNFNRRGRKTARLGVYYAFLNAAIQGTARLVETLRGPLGRKIMLGGVMLGAVNALIGMAMMGGDDGEEDNWEKIPDFVKERSLIIPLGREDYLAIPMPLGYQVFPNLGRKAVEMMMHDDPTKGVGSHIADMLRITLDAFNPLGGSENLAQMVTPTPFDPAVALMMNRDWKGKPIYLEDNSNLDPTPGHQRTKDTASAFSKAVSEALNKITGGTDYQPGAISWTPDQIDYVIGQITGGLGREILKLENTLTAPLTGDELPAYKIPLVGRLYGNTRGLANNAELFYEHVRELNKIENEIRGRARDGGDVAGYMAKEPLSALVGMGNAAENRIRKLRQYRAEVVRRAEPGYQDEVKRINEQIGEVMKLLNQEVRRAKKEAAEAP